MKMSSEKITIWVIVKHGEEVSDLKSLQFNAEEDDLECDDLRCDKAKFLEDLEEIGAVIQLFLECLMQQVLQRNVTKQLNPSLHKTQIFKLRNGRGSLIPLSRRTPQNTVTSPYILEVCEQHSSVKPCPRQVDIPYYDETCKRRLQMFVKRVSRLEETIPQLQHLRDVRLSAEMKDLESRLHFLQAKLKEAESRQWKGMFTKHPLW